MQVVKKLVDKHNGQDVYELSLQNNSGMTVNLLSFGAIIKDILFTGNGVVQRNMVLHYNDAAGYYTDIHYVGAAVGRFANRLAGGELIIDDKNYQLTKNENAEIHLHGGEVGFNKKAWEIARIFESENDVGVVFSLISPDGEEGYPGELKVEIGYILNIENELVITYKAITNAPTLINLTNHSYFNLSGGKSDISDYQLQLFSDAYTPTYANYIPTGEIKKVDNTEFDFRQPKTIKKFIHQVDTINYCLKNDQQLNLAAVVTDAESGIRLTAKTTSPGMQLYFGKYLDGGQKPFYGICLESQNYPDAPHHKNFPSAILMPGDVFRQTTSYQFSEI